MFRFNHHHQGAYYLSLLKLQLLNQSVKIHRCGLFGGVAAYFIRSVLVCVCVCVCVCVRARARGAMYGMRLWKKRKINLKTFP